MFNRTAALIITIIILITSSDSFSITSPPSIRSKSSLTMTTEVSSEASNEMILASNKRKLTTVISGAELNTINEKKHQRTLSHSISLTGFDIQTKGREEYLSEIPPKAINLCSASYGARVLFATDEWFAKADNLLKDSAPEFDPDAYCEQVCNVSS